MEISDPDCYRLKSETGPQDLERGRAGDQAMSAVDILLERVSRTRTRLEKRFSNFESSLSTRRTLPEHLVAEVGPAALQGLATRDTEEQEKLLLLEEENKKFQIEIDFQQKEKESLQKENASLNEKIGNLRESLKAMADERKKLMQKIEEGNAPTVQPVVIDTPVINVPAPESNFLNPDNSGIVQLEEKIVHLKNRRQKTALLWKAWTKKYRTLEKMVQSCQQDKEKHLNQLTALNSELDTAHEHIAELRDDLHSLETAEKIGGAHG